MNRENVNSRVSNYGRQAVNAARNGNIRGINSNLNRMNSAAVNSNRPLTPSEARRILAAVESTNSKINGLVQNVGGIKNTLSMPLKKNTFFRFTNNSRG
jgi:hypothetical protein